MQFSGTGHHSKILTTATATATATLTLTSEGLKTLSCKGQSGGCAMSPAGLPPQNLSVALLPWSQWCLFPSQFSTPGNLAFFSTCRDAALVALTNFWQAPCPQIKITLIKARFAPLQSSPRCKGRSYHWTAGSE